MTDRLTDDFRSDAGSNLVITGSAEHETLLLIGISFSGLAISDPEIPVSDALTLAASGAMGDASPRTKRSGRIRNKDP